MRCTSVCYWRSAYLWRAGYGLLELSSVYYANGWIRAITNPPQETLVIMGIAVCLVILLFATRNAFLFGIAYTLYSAMNLWAVIHFRSQLRIALTGSVIRLQEESADPSDSAQF